MATIRPNTKLVEYLQYESEHTEMIVHRLLELEV
jgi:hypothetical protein